MIVTLVVLAALIACFVGAASVARSVRLTEYTSFRGKGSFFQVFMTLLGTLVGGFMFFGLSLYEHAYYPVTALGIYLVGLGLYFNLTVAASVVSSLVVGTSIYFFGGV